MKAERRWNAIKKKLDQGLEFHQAVKSVDRKITKSIKTHGRTSFRRTREREFSDGFKEASEGLISIVSEPARKIIDAIKVAHGLFKMKKATEQES